MGSDNTATRESGKVPTPYRLTLTHDERRAIFFVGYRYRNGNELFHCLLDCSENEWDEPGDIEFLITESIAWEIEGIVDGGLSLFGPVLVAKLEVFCQEII